MKQVDRDTLCGLIPHTGNMCLLDRVESWDEKNIVCTALSHLTADNPLRRNGKLAAIHALEYAAQAMAVHGGLTAQRANKQLRSGFLVAVRHAQFHIDRLDRLDQPLTILATQLIDSDTNQIYQTEVSAASQLIMEARMTTMNMFETVA
jgi:predicted hotdog family 3-hydroxylacyl-ACP dehydratase